MTLFKLIIFFWGINIAAQSAQADIYEGSFLSMGKDYLRRLGGLPTDDVSRLSGAAKDQCASRYGSILGDGIIDIRIIIGYFDWTTGSTVNYSGRNYGYSPSIDPGAYAALRNILKSRCPGRAEFCGFSQNSTYSFSKNVVVQKRKYRARVEMVYASVSEYYSANTGRYVNQQQQRSQAAQAAFNSALRNADAVFYFGHSRDGGGPDFSPPIFVRGTNKVNYNGYYRVQRPGMKKMLAALSSGRRQPSVLGLMSCDSRDHFLSSIRRVAPKMGVISSKDVLKVDGVYTALIGGVDAILRGQCQSGFNDSLRLTSFNQRYITMDRMFE